MIIMAILGIESALSADIWLMISREGLNTLRRDQWKKIQPGPWPKGEKPEKMKLPEPTKLKFKKIALVGLRDLSPKGMQSTITAGLGEGRPSR
jgi:hypothetical protein